MRTVASCSSSTPPPRARPRWSRRCARRWPARGASSPPHPSPTSTGRSAGVTGSRPCASRRAWWCGRASWRRTRPRPRAPTCCASTRDRPSARARTSPPDWHSSCWRPRGTRCGVHRSSTWAPAAACWRWPRWCAGRAACWGSTWTRWPSARRTATPRRTVLRTGCGWRHADRRRWRRRRASTGFWRTCCGASSSRCWTGWRDACIATDACCSRACWPRTPSAWRRPLRRWDSPSASAAAAATRAARPGWRWSW